MNELLAIIYEYMGYYRETRVTCLGHLGKPFDDEKQKIMDSHWKALWMEVRPVYTPDLQSESDRCRLENVTGKWSQNKDYEHDQVYSDGYDSDRGDY